MAFATLFVFVQRQPFGWKAVGPHEHLDEYEEGAAEEGASEGPGEACPREP